VLLKNLKKARSTLINGAVRKGERLVTPAALDLYMRLSFPAPEARTKVRPRVATVFCEGKKGGKKRKKWNLPSIL